VIEYGELERVGGSQPLQVNVRLVCATNANLPEMVYKGTFRADYWTVWPLMWCNFPVTPAPERYHADGRSLCHPDVPRT
jgi:transcriptional regulator of aromatic amino acid metabolism